MLKNACKLKFRITEINTCVFIKCTEPDYHNYEISTMWETETRTTPQKSARLLMGPAQVRRPETQRAIWRWCKSKFVGLLTVTITYLLCWIVLDWVLNGACESRCLRTVAVHEIWQSFTACTVDSGYENRNSYVVIIIVIIKGSEKLMLVILNCILLHNQNDGWCRLAVVRGTYRLVVRFVSQPLKWKCWSIRIVQFNGQHLYTLVVTPLKYHDNLVAE